MPVSKKTDNKLTPYWQSDCGRAVIYLGECQHVLPQLGENLFHAIVTDPPYGLEFMGAEWDAPWKNVGGVDAKHRRADELSDPIKAKYLRHNVEYNRDSYEYQKWFLTCAEALVRAAKPGAHLLCFGGTRMWHRMACAIEDAGFEMRDTLAWMYGSGFPKGRDISKAIDAAMGAERKVIGKSESGLGAGQFTQEAGVDGGYGFKNEFDVTAPATDAAKQWDGWNTVLKPAYEPIIAARKPMMVSVETNVIEHGCGGLNIDGCRVGTTGTTVERFVATKTSTGSGVYGFNTGAAGDVTMNGDFVKLQKDGRYPSNMIHDGSPEVVTRLPTGADRFFYSAKADHSDRAHGAETVHPTVKPLDLMRYLVRLVCPRGGTVLDPFNGSGSTGCAAIEEGMYYVGIEKSKDYADVAVDRLKEMLGVHPIVERLVSGKRVVKDNPPPPKRLR